MREKFEFKFKGFHNCQSVCRVEIIRDAEANVIIFTELAENHGTSVTNAMELLLSQLLTVKPELNDEKTIIIEHYSSEAYESGKQEPEYSLCRYAKGIQNLPGIPFSEHDQSEPVWIFLAKDEDSAIAKAKEIHAGMLERKVKELVQ